MIIPITFIVLLFAGLWLGELPPRTAGYYIITALVSGCIIFFAKWDIALWLSFIAFLDAILVVHIFKGDIQIRRW